MLPPVSADDWPAIDNWWDSFRQGRDRPLILAPNAIRELPDVPKDRHWGEVDSLWDAFETDHELLLANRHVRELSDDSEADAWATVDDL